MEALWAFWKRQIYDGMTALEAQANLFRAFLKGYMAICPGMDVLRLLGGKKNG